MSSYTLIRDVSNTLKKLISQNIAELTSENSILFDSPGEVESGTITRLSIFLYQVEPNPFTRNLGDIPVGNAKLRYPPVSVDLNYMFTPYAQYRETEFIVLEKLVQLFHDNAVLKENQLEGNLQQSDNSEIRIVPVTLTLDELNKLWGIFPNKSYKLQICYKLTPVYIPSSKVRDIARVETPEIRSERTDG